MKKLLLIILSLIILTACQRNDIIGNNTPASKEGFYFDTIIQISIYGGNRNNNEKILEECFGLADELEKKLSLSIDESDISKINNNAPEFVNVSIDTISLLEKAIFYSELSDGIFDVTMGNVISMWDFTGEGKVPDLEELKKKSSYANYKNIEINKDSVRLLEPDSSIDLGGIAKGYIADKMREFLMDKGIESAIINLGGNVDIIGTKPDGSDFNVGIQNPKSEESDAIVLMNAKDMSIVTSGTYQRYFEIDGIRYHHILDKKTGMPIQNGISSVTIITEHSVDADALSTVCFLLGKDKGHKLIEDIDGTEAMFIDDNNNISFSTGCEKYIHSL